MKKITIALLAAASIAAAAPAFADEYLETTGSRNSAPAGQTYRTQERAPAAQSTWRNYYNQAPLAAPVERPAQDLPRTDPLVGSGG